MNVVVPAGKYKISSPLVIPSNSSLVGAGSRPGTQGGSEIVYAGADALDAVTLGAAGLDWSNGKFIGFRVSRSSTMTSGRGLTIVNPTNDAEVRDILVTGFPDGQIFVDNASGGGTNPGPNFFRISNFFAVGGAIPFEVQGGVQQMVVDFGGIDLDATSVCGYKASGGENEAFVTTLTGVKVEGSFDVPGFWSSGLGCQVFVGCTRYNNALNGTAAGFLMDNATQQNMNYALFGCTVKGSTKAFDAPGLTASIAGSQAAGKFISQLLVGGRGMVVPYSSGAVNFVFHQAVKLAWTDSAGSSATVDTNLYRSAADRLKTDDHLQAALGVATMTKAGTPSDADWAVAPPVGTLVVDTTANKIWARTAAATWKGVVIA